MRLDLRKGPFGHRVLKNGENLIYGGPGSLTASRLPSRELCASGGPRRKTGLDADAALGTSLLLTDSLRSPAGQ
jgi:hypothetical protein